MRKRKDSRLAIALVFAASGCSRCASHPAETTADSGAVVIVPPADAAPAPVDLLYATNAIVAVSSRVDNPRDIPDHLVDHREETAWNGKTTDLVGAWIAFRVPDDARVAWVTMSSGFDKGELFTQNHRIAKVKIEHDGKFLKDATLDTNERKPQRIDIGSAGGDFKITVTEVVAGTKTLWKEITVSELAVFGTPGKNVRAKPGPPLVRVGSLDVRERAYDDTTGATWAAACKAFVDEDKVGAEEANKGLHDDQAAVGACSDKTHAASGRGSILETAHVSIETTPSGGYQTSFSGEVLGLRTADGVKITNIRLSGKEMAWFWNVTYTLRSESWNGDELVIDVEEHRVTDSDGYAPPGHEDELHSEVKTVLRTTCEASSATCATVEK